MMISQKPAYDLRPGEKMLKDTVLVSTNRLTERPEKSAVRLQVPLTLFVICFYQLLVSIILQK